jgi:hypothetical protein
MLKRALFPAFLAAVLFLAGCGSSMLDTFPGFPVHKARLGKSVIIADFLIMKATVDTLPLVDLGATKATADTMLSFIQSRLDAKGYGVTSRLLTSAGLSMDSTFTAKVTNTSGFDREGEGFPLSIHPPFYLYQALRRDPTMRSLLASLYRRLARMEETDGVYPAMEEMAPLGKAFGGGLIFIFLGGGFEVSASIQQLGATPSWVEETAKIGYKSVSQGSLNMFVLDPDNGNVLWSDRETTSGGMMYDAKFIRMTETLLEDLP